MYTLEKQYTNQLLEIKHREIEVDDIVKTNKIMYATSITSIVSIYI